MDLLEEVAFPAPISERNLHSDRYMERVATDIPGFLKKYFNFPDDEFPEKLIHSPLLGRKIGHVPHVTYALQRMLKGGHLVLRWFTDGGKSKTITFFFPILSLAAGPDEAHIIVCDNFDDSKRRVQQLERELENNILLTTDFPWLKKPARPKFGSMVTWSRREFTIAGRSSNRPDPSMYAASITAGDVRQRRGKLLGDDIEGKDARIRASVRKELYDFVKLEAIRTWEDLAESHRPLLCWAGTPYDVDSIYIKLPREDPDYEIVTVPAYTMTWNRFGGYTHMKLADGTQSNQKTPWEERAKLIPDHVFTWPRKRMKITKQDPLLGKGMTKLQFFLAYLLDPTGGDPMRLSSEELEKLMEEAEFAEQDQWITLCSLDPAAGVGEDYAGISVVRIRWPREQKFPQIELLDCHGFEQGLFEQVNLLAELCHQHCDDQGRPARLIYESNSQQGGTYRNAFSHMHPEIQLIPIYTSAGAKFDQEMGLTVIRTLVKQQRVKVPASKLDSDGVQTLLREIRDLGSVGQHDHIACSVWFVIRWLYDQVRVYSGPPLVAAGAGRSGWGRGMVGSGGQVPNWRNWRGN